MVDRYGSEINLMSELGLIHNPYQVWWFVKFEPARRVSDERKERDRPLACLFFALTLGRDHQLGD